MKFYDILEISEDSSIEDIKKAYKRLALKYHPDISPDSKDKFLLISEAYEFLIKNHKRRNKSSSYNKMFAEMFKSIKQKTVNQTIIKVNITVEEALTGNIEKKLKIFFEVPCNCSFVLRKNCPNCKGFGLIQEQKEKSFIFQIYEFNQRCVFKKYYKDIDLIVYFNIISNEFFKVKGKTIETEENLSIFKAISGGEIPVKTLKGTEIILLPEGNISNFEHIRKGGGLFGQDHIIKFKLYLPNKLSKEQKDFLYNLKTDEN